MGSCLSKKQPPSLPSSTKVAVSATQPEPVKPIITNPNTKDKELRVEPESKAVKKEIFVIKHRNSHEKPPPPSNGVASDSNISESEPADPELGHNLIASNINLILNGTAPPPRASSCSKDEVDAILIQCGRLSRSSSGTRKYSGSKRSYDFDQEAFAGAEVYGDEDGSAENRLHRQSRASPQSRRRRTPSREREQNNQRSNSRERNSNGGGSGSRRVSRSPGRRSENNSSANTNGNGNGSCSNKPGKMVSVPATVTSMVMDKSNNGVAREPNIKRVTVKRNVSSPRAQSPARGNPNGSNLENPRARSPARTNPSGSNAENLRARSPARTNPNGSYYENPSRARSPARANPNGSNENQQQPLSRSSSRRAEQSPFRRNPLSEIDPNSLAYPQPCKNNNNNNIKSREFEPDGQKPNFSTGTQENKAMNVTLTRSRSSRRSQDLDFNFNTETLLNSNPNPNPSYTSLLLEDIQNFHQKNTTSLVTPTSFTLPACVTKACSIVEAVADLNSCTSSKFADHSLAGKRRQLQQQQQQQQQQQPKDPFVEAEVVVEDDLMEPSFQKYVTVRRGGEMGEEEESSGSNSFVGGGGGSQQQQWGISSSWEPNSADSTGRWTSRSNTRDDEDQTREMEEVRRGFSGKRRNFDHHHHQQQQQKTGIGRGRLGGNRGSQALSIAAST